MSTDLKHSEDFLSNKIGNETGFSIPKNYFDGVENSILSKLSENKIPKEKAFKVPADYFKNLEDKILSKVSSEGKEIKIISLRKRVLRFIPVAAAASVLLFIGLSYFTNNTAVTFNDITTTDLEAWYENDAENISSSDLAMVFKASDFEDDVFFETTIEDDNLEEYLNSVDNTSLLIEE